MSEVILDACGLFLDAAEAADCGSGEGFGCLSGGCGRDPVLEVGVEELVRVQRANIWAERRGGGAWVAPFDIRSSYQEAEYSQEPIQA